MSDRSAVIVGVGLSDLPRAPHLTTRQHHALAMRRALADAGIHKQDVDGYAGAEDRVADMAEYLRIDHRYLDGTSIGGSSFQTHVQHAAAAIEQGLCETVLITYGSDLLSKSGRKLGTGGKIAGGQVAADALQYESPYGNPLVGAYAMAAKRHMHEFGTTSEQLAGIAVGVREFAMENPDAMYRKPLTVDDVLSSRMVADPLHLLDCCAITDGGGAVVLTTAERARNLPQPPVYVLGAAARQTHWNIGEMPDFTTTAAVAAAAEAFGRAGLTPADVDMLMLYDSFTITCLMLLEGLGFCGRGEGGPFAQEGHLRKGGRLPLNTDGGGLSACHPGKRGIFLIIEAVRQLRGQAGPVQVPDCRVALTAGSGGWLSCMGVLLLGKEPRS